MVTNLSCPVHGTALVEKEVPIFYRRRATLKSEIDSKFPHHGLRSLGGCVVFDDSPETEIGQVCSDCHDAAKKM